MPTTLSAPDRMPLAGFFVQSVLDRVPDAARVRMAGRYRIQVGRMVVTAVISASGSEVRAGAEAPFDASLAADLPAFVEMAAGAGPVGLVLGGRLKVGGRFWKLLPLLKALKAETP